MPEPVTNKSTGLAEKKGHWRRQRRRVCRMQRRAWRRWWKKGKMWWDKNKNRLDEVDISEMG